MVDISLMKSQLLADEQDFAAVPDDFPLTSHFGSLSGTQIKLLMIKYRGRFYTPGSSPPEVYERWRICENLAVQLAKKSVESKAGKRAHLSEVEILAQYLARLIAQNWTTQEEAQWIICRVARILNWPIPHSALDRPN